MFFLIKKIIPPVCLQLICATKLSDGHTFMLVACPTFLVVKMLNYLHGLGEILVSSLPNE